MERSGNSMSRENRNMCGHGEQKIHLTAVVPVKERSQVK